MAEAGQREDEERFNRVVSLLMRTGTDIIQGLFDHFHPPSNLAHALQNHYHATLEKLKKEKILTVDEWDKIFPTDTTCGESEDFDLTLLFKLLRNICNLTAPSNGWDRLPNISDLSLEADLARIKYRRNKTYHCGVRNMKLSVDEFKERWEELSEALLRILSHYDRDPESVKEWKRKIEDIRSGPSTSLADDIKRWLLEFPKLMIKCSYKIKGFMGNAATLLFDQFRDDIQQLCVAVQDVISQSQGIIVRNIYNGSIMIQLCVKDLSDLEDLWTRYNNGQLKSELEKVLIIGDIKKLGKDVELEITMSKEEYLGANSFFKELFPPHKGKSVEIKEVKEVTERLKELSLDIIHGDTIIDRGSHFQAHFAMVTSKDQIDKVVDHIKKSQEYTDATFVWASRLYDTDKDIFVCNSDDGDELYLAGKRIQLLLEKIKVKDIVVIATCWQGEEYLDLDIYKNINERVLSLLMRHGLLERKTPEELAVSLEKFEAYFEKRKHKIAYAGYEAMKQAEQETQSSEFEFIHSEVIADRKSKFQAHLARVTSQEQVEQALEQLKRDSKIAKATYNMLAYRIYVKEKKSYLEEGRDDGENEAGKRLMHLLEASKVVDAVVIVTRWHGGVHIGPDRFKHINACALEVIKIATDRGMFQTASESAKSTGTQKKRKEKGKGKQKSKTH